jgi:hypothetical protein
MFFRISKPSLLSIPTLLVLSTFSVSALAQDQDQDPAKAPAPEVLRADRIAQVIKARKVQVLDCYNQELKTRSDLSGRLTVSFDISNEHPGNIVVDGMTTTLHSCVQSRIENWRFAQVVETRGIRLTYSLQPS